MLKKNLLVFGVLAFATVASASNQTFIFSGTSTPLTNDIITNPYDGTTVILNGTYNVNNTTYTGVGSNNTLLMTNSADLLTLDSALTGQTPNVQTLVDIDYRVITGNGNDFVDLASSNFTLPAGLTIFGGSGNETIWTNSGDTTVNPGSGNMTVRGGPGNDTITGYIGIDNLAGGAGNDTINSGANDDTIDGGPGNDSLTGGAGHNTIDGGIGTDTYTTGAASPMSAYSITRTGPASFTIAALDSSSVDQLTNVEFAQFSDQTLDLSTIPTPEPASLSLVSLGILPLLRRQHDRT